jgi:hypothetical protein
MAMGILKDRVAVQTVSRVAGADGTVAETWGTKNGLSSVACWIYAAGATSRNTNGKGEIIYTHEITLEAGVTVDDLDDRFVGVGGEWDGRIFEIVGKLPGAKLICDYQVKEVR